MPGTVLVAVLGLGIGGGAAAQQTGRQGGPLSAIDWLSDSLEHTAPYDAALPGQNTRRGGLHDEPIEVHPLGAPVTEVVGLFPAQHVGLPRGIWGPTPSDVLSAQLRALRPDTLPAAQELLRGLLLAEFDPPVTGLAGPDSDLLLARIDTLVAFGAVEQALQLVASGARLTPDLWARWFDMALLLGEEDRACAAQAAMPDLRPARAARIFCLARGGDWAAAALTLQTSETLGRIDGTDAMLLRRFLDPEDAEIPAARSVPHVETPLQWRLLEAIGEPVHTSALPLAFAHADLRGTAGWRAQIEAAERLTRSGALAPNRLLGLYTEARAAASGGIWDRVRAVSAFEQALAAGSPDAIGPQLLTLWHQAQVAELESAFAVLFADRLDGVRLEGAARMAAFEMALLAQGAAAALLADPPAGPRAAFLAALAGGIADPALGAQQTHRDLAQAIAAGLSVDADLPEAIAAAIAEGALGHAALIALERLAEGAAGDTHATAQALAILRALGLDSVARRAALELMILQRAG